MQPRFISGHGRNTAGEPVHVKLYRKFRLGTVAQLLWEKKRSWRLCSHDLYQDMVETQQENLFMSSFTGNSGSGVLSSFFFHQAHPHVHQQHNYYCLSNMLLVNVWICLMIMISQQEPSLNLFVVVVVSRIFASVIPFLHTNWKDKHKPREYNQTQKVTGRLKCTENTESFPFSFFFPFSVPLRSFAWKLCSFALPN